MIPAHLSGSESAFLHHRHFRSVEEQRAFTQAELSRLSPANRIVLRYIDTVAASKIRLQSDWYGHPKPQSLEELQNHQAFLGMDRFRQLQPEIRQYMNRFLPFLREEEQRHRRLRYNARGLGVFSFDRAAMDLFRHQPIRTDSPAAITQTQLGIALGRTRVRTSVREVYAYFEEKPQQKKTMRLYLYIGGASELSGDQLYYTGLACTEVIRYMEARRIPSVLTVVSGTTSLGPLCISTTVIKDAETPLDINQLLLHCSDPRYYRYQGFQHIVALHNAAGYRIEHNLGERQPGQVKAYLLEQDPDALLFGDSHSIQEAVQEVARMIEKISS